MKLIFLTATLFLCSLRLVAVTLISSSRQPADDSKFGKSGQVCAGVNIHFVEGHEKDLDMIADAGFRYIRMDFVWHEIERVKGMYEWTAYEELTANLGKRKLRAIYILDYSNTLYEPVVDFNDPITGEGRRGVASPQHPESVAAFAQWAASAVKHFQGNDIVWEIWNEPNVSFWRPQPDVEQYITLASAAAKAIREVVPDAIIIGPATSKAPLPFIEKYLASGAMEYLDGVSVHPYRDYSLSPETANTDYIDLRGLMARYAPAGKNIPVISSEWGYASATKGVSREKQAEFLVRMQLANLLYGIPVSIWYDWKNDGDQPGNFEHNCGTVTSRLEPKPAYIAAKTMNTELKGSTLSHRIDLQNDNDFVLMFRDKKGRQKLAAWTMGSSHPVTTPDAFRATCVDGYGTEIELRSENGGLVLELTTLPQYVRVLKGR